MNRTLCSGKIHRATVTDSNLNYEGSITIDEGLLYAADILPYEKVQVVNINNGARFETYVITGELGSGEICLNGAASRMVEVGDKVIIIAYRSMSMQAAENFTVNIVMVDENNRIINSSATTQAEHA